MTRNFGVHCRVRQWADTTGCTACGRTWDTNDSCPPPCPNDRFVPLSPRLSIARDEPKRPLACRIGLHRWTHVSPDIRLCLSCSESRERRPHRWTWKRILAWWFILRVDVGPMTTFDSRSALAARMFPREWVRWATTSGKAASKQRNKLRKAAEEKVRLDVMRAEGRRCANCDSYRKPSAPLHPREPWCAADSDFYGYALTTPGHLCALHQWKEPQR